MSEEKRSYVDNVIIGNGPAALILSFVLHGNIPYYDLEHPHPDPILHAKLKESPCLLDLDVDELTAHFDGSRISYSTQALPVNVLLDTLLRPLADVEPGEHASTIIWKKERRRAVDHLVIGDSPQAGGQWADNPVSASHDIGALSYLDQLSLPGYTIYDHLKISPKSLNSSIRRPTRRQLAEYFAAYPAAVGIQDSVLSGSVVSGVRRTSTGFYIGSHDLHCRNLVLASGTFTNLLQPPPELAQLSTINESKAGKEDEPVLVVGSGFSAADIIISNVQKRKVLHIFKWQPGKRPSPLQACHPQAYPDYAGVYRQMKEASKKRLGDDNVVTPTPRKVTPFFEESLWAMNYEGFPNGSIRNVEFNQEKAIVTIEVPGRDAVTREVGAFAYVTGRRGSLEYLEEPLQLEVLDRGDFAEPGAPTPKPNQPISGSALRDKTIMDVEVAQSVFAVGSLTGDSLIRFAYGSCVQAAGRIVKGLSRPASTSSISSIPSPRKSPACRASPVPNRHDMYKLTNGHEDLGRDRDREDCEAHTSQEAKEDTESSHEEEEDGDNDAEDKQDQLEGEISEEEQSNWPERRIDRVLAFTLRNRKSCTDFGRCVVS